MSHGFFRERGGEGGEGRKVKKKSLFHFLSSSLRLAAEALLSQAKRASLAASVEGVAAYKRISGRSGDGALAAKRLLNNTVIQVTTDWDHLGWSRPPRNRNYFPDLKRLKVEVKSVQSYVHNLSSLPQSRPSARTKG